MVETRTRAVHPKLSRDGVHVFERFLSAGFSEDFSVFSEDRLAFVQYGNGVLEVRGDEIALSEGELTYLPGGTPHRWHNPADRMSVLLFIGFMPGRLADFAPAGRAVAGFAASFPAACAYDPGGSHLKARILTAIRSMRHEQRSDDAAATALIWANLVELIVVLGRAWQTQVANRELSSRDRAFAASLAYLHEHAHEPLQLRDLAEMAGMSYRAYTELFRAKTGTTFSRYITELRIEIAKERLLDSRDILHASLEAGFGDLSNFYRVFKKHTGLTPRQFTAAHGSV